MREHFIDIEDLNLNSLHTTLVFQLCPPLETPVSYGENLR